MPMTGGREDIGPETGWTATYLTSQNADAEKVMYANADAAGSVPWHFVDNATGDAIRVDQHPGLWIDSRGTWGTDALPVAYNPSTTGWTPEVAHQPNLSYVPYLLSGEHYYLDELQAQASYTIAAFAPDYRQGGAGIIPDITQARALAWAIRDISDAAYITPNGEALKAYYTTALNNTLNNLITQYVNGPKGAAEGQLQGWIDGDFANAGWIRPWMQDYLGTTMAYVSQKGFTQADTMLAWMDNFLSGRFTNGVEGINPLYGATYNFEISPLGGAPYQTWAEVFSQTFGTTPTLTQGEGAIFDWAGGYAANAKASLAGVISSTQSPDAIEAYGWLQSQTTAMVTSYQTLETWNIVPKLADGQYLTQDKIHVHTTTDAATMTAGAGDTMLVGNVGNDTIVGGSGIGLLFGMDGNDTITAGSGNSYLYGGNGNDRLVDGAGNNYFKGGAGADVFAFSTATTGQDTVDDFTKGTDRIEIKSNGSGVTAASLVAQATADAHGNAVLHLGSHDIVLQGVMLGNVTQDIFTIA
jgi:Ca2+-binding RTX toxin-like protein